MVRKSLEEIAGMSKQADKISALKNLEKEFTKLPEFLDYLTNPDYRYNIHVKFEDLLERSHSRETINDASWETLIKPTLDKLKAREITGNAAKDLFHKMTFNFVIEDGKLLYDLLNRNIKLGISRSTFIKIWGGETMNKRKFEVALAKGYDPNKDNITDGTWIGSRKLDGMRIVAFVTEDNVKFYSRNGKEIYAMGKVKADIMASPNFKSLVGKCLDGEICIIENGVENFQKAVGEAKRKDYTMPNPTYVVFDVFTHEEFWQGSNNVPYSERLKEAETLTRGIPTIQLVEHFEITPETLTEYLAKVKTSGWEGLMARKNSGYENGRGKNLLKIKDFHDAEYIVEDIQIEDIKFNEPGKGIQVINCVKAIKIRHKGNIVSVGSGINKEDRIAWKADPSLIVGKTVTVKYFEESKSGENYSLRFPVFIGVRDYE